MKHYIEYSYTKYPDNIFISYKNYNITFSDFYHNGCTKSRALTSLNLIK